MTGSSALPTSPTTAAGHAAAASFAALTAELDYLLPSDIDNVRRAYRFADEAHLGQLRKNGDPYITHPIAVAAQCAQWKLDAQTLMAALMHDAMEDCGITKENLIERFGVPVAELVDGLTKLEKLDYHTREQNQAESFRKMLLAMSRDVRVILIKIADRLHNMRTMGDMPRNKWGRISQETLDIYAPMAHRLGLNVAFRELQDLAFKHRYPWRYSVLQKAVNHSRTSRRDVIQRVIAETRNALSAQGLHAQVQGREKTLYSIFRKMREKHLELKEVHDRYGVRVVVETNLQCYTTVGVLHQLYKPATIKFKDYIALPKDNGYQSLHTTVRGPFNADIEFQIRTNAMNVVAESGVAAHWLYKASAPDSDTAHRLGTKWLQSLMEIQQETGESSDFLHNVRVDLLPDSLYVNTPKGRVISLPRGATAVDFAYAVHSDIGNKAVAATVNGERVPLRTELKNGDVVDISTEPAQRPDPAWLSFVRTGRARSKIRHHLKALAYADARVLGEKIFLQALRTEGIAVLPAVDGPYRPCWDKLLRFTGNRLASDLLADIGMGKHIAGMVGKKFATLLGEAGLKPDVVLISLERYLPRPDALSQGVISLDGSEGASVHYANCCHPIPGDRIVGHLGRGDGLNVHTEECSLGKRLLLKDREHFMEVEWAEDPVRPFDVALQVTVENGRGVLARVASALADAGTDITHFDMGEERAQHLTDLRFSVAVSHRIHLAEVLRSLKRLPMVHKAQRIRHHKSKPIRASSPSA